MCYCYNIIIVNLYHIFSHETRHNFGELLKYLGGEINQTRLNIKAGSDLEFYKIF